MGHKLRALEYQMHANIVAVINLANIQRSQRLNLMRCILSELEEAGATELSAR